MITWKIRNVPKDLESLTKMLSRQNIKHTTWLFLVEHIKCENREARIKGTA